ncbi:MAG: hypothetical protein ABIE14_01990 [Patescibacteria group bacterium]
MKKIFATFVLVFLLVGCGAASQQSFLDEKIKCKDLANKRLENLQGNWDLIELIESDYFAELDTCIAAFIGIKKYSDGRSTGMIEDIVSGQTIAQYDSALTEANREYFDKKELYFGEDAE